MRPCRPCPGRCWINITGKYIALGQLTINAMLKTMLRRQKKSPVLQLSGSDMGSSPELLRVTAVLGLFCAACGFSFKVLTEGNQIAVWIQYRKFLHVVLALNIRFVFDRCAPFLYLGEQLVCILNPNVFIPAIARPFGAMDWLTAVSLSMIMNQSRYGIANVGGSPRN